LEFEGWLFAWAKAGSIRAAAASMSLNVMTVLPLAKRAGYDFAPI
jgi:hypothetical protein